MKNFNLLFLTLFLIFIPNFAFGDEADGKAANTSAHYQQIIDEYKAYAAKIPVKTREEIVAYRTEIAKLNKEKRLLFRKLSGEAQEYLEKEQEYKNKLSIDASEKENKKP